MELSKQDTKMFKGVAILFMLLLHLFCRKEVNGLYETFPLINGVPLVYYIGLFGDACVPIYCFVSGYSLYILHNKEKIHSIKKNVTRIFKLIINFWIVLILFTIVGCIFDKEEAFLGGITEFFLNFFLLSNSYNGAWWFLQTYVLLVLLTPFFTKVVRKYNSFGVLIIFGLIYLVSYIQRVKYVFDFSDYALFQAIVNAMVLVGTSAFPFIIGFIFAKEKIYSKIYNFCHEISYKNTICFVGIIMLVVIHSLYESMIIAPFTAILFICLFSLMQKSKLIQQIFIFFGDHSTNIWLTHMFFYMSIFPELTFAPKYPILIFAWLIVLCLISSHVINIIYKPIARSIDRRVSSMRDNSKIAG